MGERLQAALPREQYVDRATWMDEREAVLFGEWFCLGRLTDLGLHEAGRLAVVDVVGESVLVTSDETGLLHAVYNVCRHRGSQIVPFAERGGTTTCAAAAAALPVPLLDLRAGRPVAQGATRRPRRPGVVRADRGRRRDLGRLRVRAPDARARGPPRRLDRRAPPRRWPTTGSRASSPAARFTYDVAANYKVLLENYNECYHCGPVHPELSRLVPSFAGGGDDLDWESGHPAPRRCVDLHDDRHHLARARCRA